MTARRQNPPTDLYKPLCPARRGSQLKAAHTLQALHLAVLEKRQRHLQAPQHPLRRLWLRISMPAMKLEATSGSSLRRIVHRTGATCPHRPSSLPVVKPQGPVEMPPVRVKKNCLQVAWHCPEVSQPILSPRIRQCPSQWLASVHLHLYPGRHLTLQIHRPMPLQSKVRRHIHSP